MNEKKTSCAFLPLFRRAQLNPLALSQEEWSALSSHLQNSDAPCPICSEDAELFFETLPDYAETSPLKFPLAPLNRSFTSGPSVNRAGLGSIIDEDIQSHLAMAASDSEDQLTHKTPSFFPLGTVSVNGTSRQLLTDGRRIAIRVSLDEQQPVGLFIDEEHFDVSIPEGAGLAIVNDFFRGQADRLLREINEDASKHVLRWKH